jgi:Holliday junction DNA helicase RuvB
MVGAGTSAHAVHFPLPPFTLIGATTRAGMLSEPLRARFGIISHMEYYTTEELREIITRSADIFDVEILERGAHELARRSRGTPRIANRLLKRVRDFAQVTANGVISDEIADQALSMLQVDSSGLDLVDQKLMRTLIELYNGGPVGVAALAVNISEDAETVEEMYEPYLMQIGFIKRTSRGRVATEEAYRHFGYELP